MGIEPQYTVVAKICQQLNVVNSVAERFEIRGLSNSIRDQIREISYAFADKEDEIEQLHP
jgi:hypothetical protein